ncbi:MAG: phosphoglycerate dehydrogenase [Candidatus Latescibacterota bacterium]|nr:phosphoglycerate dehydrogenase [Candidatus Latescibacterota bacterium]
MKVLISDKVDPGCVEILERGGEITVDIHTGLCPEELLEVIGGYEGLIVRSATQVTEEIIGRAERLRAIGRAGAGVDNIDVDAATRRGMVVMNTPGGNSVSTAEHTMAMLMALARNVPQATASLKDGRWDRSKYIGVELAGKTIGVIGLGKVGGEVAQRAAGFRMSVLGYDPYLAEEAVHQYGKLADLEQIWAEANFITVHMPLTPQTHNMINAETLAKCREGVRILNCARGGIVDEGALLDALNSGKVAGAALDVFEEEPPPADYKLLQHENVIATPHLAASTQEAQTSVALQVADQVRELLVGGVIRNAVNVPSLDPEVYQVLRPYLQLAEYLGRAQAQLAEGQLERITIEYRGVVAEQPTSALTSAVLKGIMETIAAEGAVNFVNAPILAQERGIGVEELKSREPEDFASLITVIYQTNQGPRVLSGTLFGKRDPRIVRLDEYELDAVPEGHMLFYVNNDIPGIIGRIGTIMGTHKVNIAQMSCGRQQVGGRALTVLNIDSYVPDEVLEELLSDPHILWARPVEL